jgi:hypothetical protein
MKMLAVLAAALFDVMSNWIPASTFIRECCIEKKAELFNDVTQL